MIRLIERAAAAGVRLALLSNIPEELASHYEHHHAQWLRHFELVAFSSRIGHAKPEPAAFLWCCDRLGVPPGSVLFIDDTTVNIHAAERLGMHTHQFTEPAGTAQGDQPGANRVAEVRRQALAGRTMLGWRAVRTDCGRRLPRRLGRWRRWRVGDPSAGGARPGPIGERGPLPGRRRRCRMQQTCTSPHLPRGQALS
ncbi:HAD-IA family hydrolase [Micromonospora sp. NPDC048868]|uniref:HAD-IA family hydrolase n=1 Tax=Micromonospora sp. NPDC048868 TaxID=3364258 RepID=UPI003712AD83